MRQVHEGMTFPPSRYEVSREKVREYALATGHPVPPEEGDGPVPLAFAAAFAVTRDGGPLMGLAEGAGLVHTSQELEAHRPLRLGDVLTCTGVVESASSATAQLITIRTDCVDQAGEPVLTARAVVLRTPLDTAGDAQASDA